MRRERHPGLGKFIETLTPENKASDL